MGADLTVRAATAEDLDDIQSVARDTWHEVYDDILTEETIETMLAEGYTEEVLGQMVELDDVGLFVAEDDRRIVGYASCGMTDTVGLGDLDVYVHPEYWGEGVGEQLLERGRSHLSDIGVSRVRDEVLAENEVGNAFYRKHFEPVGEREVDFGGETHRVNVYELTLD